MKFGTDTVRFGKKGMSDLLGILEGGYFLAIEVKSAKGKLTEEQENFLAMVNRFGGCGIVARSVAEATEHVDAFLAMRRPW